MFSDPITITYNGVSKVLARVETIGKRSVYQTDDETFVLTISHQTQKNGRIRSVVRLDMNAVVTDPISSENDQETITLQTVKGILETGAICDSEPS